MSDIQKRNEESKTPIEAYKDRIGTMGRLSALGTGAACVVSGLILSFQGADPSILFAHSVYSRNDTVWSCNFR